MGNWAAQEPDFYGYLEDFNTAQQGVRRFDWAAQPYEWQEAQRLIASLVSQHFAVHAAAPKLRL